MRLVSRPADFRARPAASLGLALALAATAAFVAASPESVSDDMEVLLRRSDVAEHEPAAFRSRIRLQGAGQELEIEVWRAGASRTLVRFLGAKHRGKFLLYLPQGVFFLAPGARQPVKLPRSYRLHGSATLDQVLGLHYSRDFAIRGAGPAGDGSLVAFELEARDLKAQYPRVRYLVLRRTARPTLAALHLRGGKLATSVEFTAWAPGPAPRPLRLVLRDHLRGAAATHVELLEFLEQDPPEGLFDLQDGAARRRLTESTATP